MAASKREINRVNSPMYYTEERLDETREQSRERRSKLEDVRSKKSPFLIGSIDTVNRKISNLDRKLQACTALVVESRASSKCETESFIESDRSERGAKSRDYDRLVNETKEVNQFAGIYAIKSTFFGKPSERVRNISKISMSPSKTNQKKDTGKPKFVELHQYPGYDATELTPFPHDASVLEILSKVARAQHKLKSQNRYKPEFERLFYSQMSQAILQDIFWWLFLEKWQSNKDIQPKLFNRVAHNYVKLLTYAKHPVYRDTFLKDYPSLLSQAVYAGYCEAFPDSYRQFNDDFKSFLIGLVYGWVAGVTPAPRSWSKWDMAELEPANIKQREELLNQSKKEKENKFANLELEFPKAPNSVMSGSLSTINAAPSMSSMSSQQGGRRYTRHSKKLRKGADSQSQQSSDALSSSVDNGKGSNDSKSKRRLVNSSQPEQMDPLTPIREFDEENAEEEERARANAAYMKSYHDKLKQKHRERESIPACRGPDFVRGVFNVCGQSPLVAHFLKSKHLLPDAGVAVRVQRTQMQNLPPIDAPTYRNVMDESYKTVRDIEKRYQEKTEVSNAEHIAFQKRQKHMMKDYHKKEQSLLSQQREVKRLSDLIMLELRKDEDSISAGSAQALEHALNAQAVD